MHPTSQQERNREHDPSDSKRWERIVEQHPDATGTSANCGSHEGKQENSTGNVGAAELDRTSHGYARQERHRGGRGADATARHR
jgi:hypothetical protein